MSVEPYALGMRMRVANSSSIEPLVDQSGSPGSRQVRTGPCLRESGLRRSPFLLCMGFSRFCVRPCGSPP